MTSRPSVSFIIPGHDCGATVERTLRSIAAQKYPAIVEVLVVTADPLDSAAIERACPSASVIALKQRHPAGPARNEGARAATAELLAFVDADVALPSDWLGGLVAAVTGDERVVAASGAVVNANPQKWPSRVLHWLEFSEFLPGADEGPRRFLSSSNLLLTRKRFEEVGGFDENLEMSEDLDLSLRLGGILWFAGEPGIDHFHRDKWRAVRQHLHRLGFWSGTFRRTGALEGTWLRRAPALSFLLPVFRVTRVVARAFGSGRRVGARVLLHTPLLLLALLWWSAGFYRGLRKPGD